MAKCERFEDLPVWQEAARLCNVVPDLIEESGASLSPGFCNQPDRAALSVSNNIAEGFERLTKAELLSFIAIARRSASEVRSMMAVVKNRPKLRTPAPVLRRIRGLAKSCARQLTGWAGALDELPFDGARHLPARERKVREMAGKAKKFRLGFLKALKPAHPFYHMPEVRAARGDPPE